jgi:anti-sigma factor RsiW
MTEIDSTHQHCLAMFDKLSQFIDNELDPVTQKKIERHVKTCLPCYSCLETLKRTVAFCGHTKNRPIPETLTLALRKLVQNIR